MHVVHCSPSRPHSYVASHATDDGLRGGPCLFVVCLRLPRVVDMLCVHGWPSVALECVQM